MKLLQIIITFCVCVIGSQTKGPLVLTPYLEKNQIQQAQQAAKVKNQKLFGNVVSYSGYFTVNKKFNSNTFFWFFPSEKGNWTENPILLWLNGGPGSTSMFGVGYSFTNKGGRPSTLWGFGEDLYNALTQFFQLFPKLKKCDFYLTGESYAGKYLSALGYQIDQRNVNASSKINLKGVIIGNGFFYPKYSVSKINELVYSLGLLDEYQKIQVDVLKRLTLISIDLKQWVTASKLALQLNKLLIDFTGFSSIYNIAYPKGTTTEQEGFMNKFVQREDVKKAIHTENVTFNVYNFQVNVMDYLDNLMQDVTPWIEHLLNKYPVLFYNGHWDILASYTGTTAALRSLDFRGSQQYRNATRQKWYVNQELAGYIKKGGNLVEVLIRNAGHMAPTDQPLWTLKLITNFIANYSVVCTS
ncbi:hypothetical protein FQR65_LT03443 [Abscondita terminalis]|nr:hypothetical protein FQR65_LT03443 [Abscondita terminalis]